jgi:hypothetical protein
VLALATGCPPDTAVDVHLDAVLDDRRGVLVLDNCEHLVAAAAAAAELLLAWCPTLRILATSVEPLGVADEVLYPVEPLGLPDSADPAAILGSNAGRLFVERATRVRPDLEVDSAAASSVYEICQGVGGLPLALELAGGRCLQRSLDEIARSASRPLRDQVDAALDAVSATDGRSVAALSIVEPPIDDRLAAAALSAVGVNAADGQTVVQRLADRSLVQMQSGGIRLHEGVRVVAQARLSSVDRRAIAEHLLAESLQATSDPIAVSAHEVFVRTASRLIEDESLPIGARQRLAAQLGPWWTARLGGKRARDRLMEMLSLSAEGPAATAVHLAIADSYGAGRETLETERHLREAARMLGRHDVVDPAVVDRLKSLTAKLRSGEDAES